MKLETIKVGKIVGTHGVRGEVRVQPRDGDPAFLAGCKTFLMDGKPLTPASCRIHKNLALMVFPGVEDVDGAQSLRNKDLYIRREDARLPDGECFDDELLGMDVFNGETGERLGELVRVDLYPAHKVYTVKGEKEYLIPAVKDAFILSVNLEENRMEVRVWEGMDS